MRNTRVLFTASLVAGMGAALGAGCGSSKSSGSSTAADGSTNGSGDAAMEASGGPGSGCSPIGLGGAVTLCDPGMDLTCCVDLSGGLSSLESAFLGGGMLGTCVTTASCTGSLNVQCEAPTDCTTGQSCCGGATGDAGALAAELAEAGDASFSLDASTDAAINLDAAASLFAGLGFNSSCTTSCTTSQYQLCSSTADCTGVNAGNVCGPPSSALFGGSGTVDGISLGSIITFMVCQPPDAGGTPIEAGSTEKSDAGTDAGAGTTDGGSTDASSTVTDGASSG